MYDRAAQMTLLAAETRKRADIREATRQLLVALNHENRWRAADERRDARGARK